MFFFPYKLTGIYEGHRYDNGGRVCHCTRRWNAHTEMREGHPINGGEDQGVNQVVTVDSFTGSHQEVS